MKKNAFLTFIFACIPGAGQMYYGYMKRGLSMITFFCLFIMAGTLVDVLVVGSVIVWMYSFFDTYDLIRHLAAGEPKDDDLLLPANWDNIRAILPQHNKLLGWGLIAFGVWALYDILIADWMTTVLVLTPTRPTPCRRIRMRSSKEADHKKAPSGRGLPRSGWGREPTIQRQLMGRSLPPSALRAATSLAEGGAALLRLNANTICIMQSEVLQNG